MTRFNGCFSLRVSTCLFIFTLCGRIIGALNERVKVVVMEEDDVILPCSLSTKENIESMLFDWKKDGQKEVFFYDAGLHYNNGRSGQDEQFKGRVSHFPDQLKHGIASIKIQMTKVADSGNYTCIFPLHQPSQTFHIELVVGAALDPNIPEEGPSAPPPGWLDNVHGYQSHTGGDGDNPLYPPPPAYNPQPELNRNTSVPNVRVPTVSEDVARDALLKFVESKWRYSSKPARNLTFRELRPITVYRYRLETFTETRTSTWLFEPYNGQLVDGPQYGVSPSPWDIPVSYPQKFTDRVEKVRVPHSSFVKMCHMCSGCGRTRCISCSGRGMKRCLSCHGKGFRKQHGNHKRSSGNVRCSFCHGRGRKRCNSCHGQGFKMCSVCHGSQNLLHFIQLTVTWKNNIDVFIPDRQPDFPDKKFEKVTGDPFFVDESVLVYPIQGFPDQEICDVSTKMINGHLDRFRATSRILQQRQAIELVPLTHAYYTYSGKDYSFFVYGVENQVFAAKYPTACSIL